MGNSSGRVGRNIKEEKLVAESKVRVLFRDKEEWLYGLMVR